MSRPERERSPRRAVPLGELARVRRGLRGSSLGERLHAARRLARRLASLAERFPAAQELAHLAADPTDRGAIVEVPRSRREDAHAHARSVAWQPVRTVKVGFSSGSLQSLHL